ncbi:hypothetical protein EJ06DRAFT_254670 [Trichodelitschia bisporula]|uniref:Uncharacterized protein n=1 Tax=Trichodelitschia bisporula TaxID=703511 RepID=A0A6G1HJ65_9PEZI|nr:hypothetical protein EJ06DRAFT_254670 [Trichodelitschia bisporula]
MLNCSCGRLELVLGNAPRRTSGRTPVLIAFPRRPSMDCYKYVRDYGRRGFHLHEHGFRRARSSLDLVAYHHLVVEVSGSLRSRMVNAGSPLGTQELA